MKKIITCMTDIPSNNVSALPKKKWSRRQKRKRSNPRPYQLIEDGTVRKGVLIMSEGFSYVRNVWTETTDYMRCRISRDKLGCRGRAVLDKRKGLFYVTMPHTCMDEDFVFLPNSRLFQQL